MIRSEVKAADGQPVAVANFSHPRIEEVAALLPVSWGSALLKSQTAKRWLSRLLGPRTLRTDRVSMQVLLRGLASVRRFRRSTFGYAHERNMMTGGTTPCCLPMSMTWPWRLQRSVGW